MNSVSGTSEILDSEWRLPERENSRAWKVNNPLGSVSTLLRVWKHLPRGRNTKRKACDVYKSFEFSSFTTSYLDENSSTDFWGGNEKPNLAHSVIDLDSSRIAKAAEQREEIYNFKKSPVNKAKTPKSNHWYGGGLKRAPEWTMKRPPKEMKTQIKGA